MVMMRLIAVAGNFLVIGNEIFIDFSIKSCQKVAAKLLFGRGLPAKQQK